MKKRLPSGIVKRDEVYYADFTVGGPRTRKRLSTNPQTATSLLYDLRAKAFDRLLNRAKERNKAFFEKFGLPTT